MAPPTWQAFDQMAADYEKNTGGATRIIAKHLADLVNPIPANSKILDNASGTGLVIDELLATINDDSVKYSLLITCADIAPAMTKIIDWKAQHTWKLPSDHARIETLAAEDLDSLPSNYYTHSFANFGIMSFHDLERATAHIYRTLAPGGTAYVTTWKDVGYMGAVNLVEKKLRPGKELTKLPFDYKWFDGGYLDQVMKEAGFAEVKVHEAEGAWAGDGVKGIGEGIGNVLKRLWKGRGWTEEQLKALPDELVKVFEDGWEGLNEDGDKARLRMVAYVAVCRK